MNERDLSLGAFGGNYKTDYYCSGYKCFGTFKKPLALDLGLISSNMSTLVVVFGGAFIILASILIYL